MVSDFRITKIRRGPYFDMKASHIHQMYEIYYREYLVLVRIQAASVMLLETNKSIAEIALACGFRDSNYFGDAFKREKGVSLSAYRKNSNDTQSPAVPDGIPRRD